MKRRVLKINSFILFKIVDFEQVLFFYLTIFIFSLWIRQFYITFARSWYEKFCLWHDNVPFIKNFFLLVCPSIVFYEVFWSWPVLEASILNQLMSLLMNCSKSLKFFLFLSFWYMYRLQFYFFLSDFKRLYDFFFIPSHV